MRPPRAQPRNLLDGVRDWLAQALGLVHQRLGAVPEPRLVREAGYTPRFIPEVAGAGQDVVEDGGSGSVRADLSAIDNLVCVS